MTKQEAEKKLQEKVEVIAGMCRQLKIEMKAFQKISQEGFIENVIFFTDNEKYDIEEVKPVQPETIEPAEAIEPEVVTEQENETKA